MTSDVGVPVFRCQIVDERDDAMRRGLGVEGAGCHPSREVALSRALTEAAQSRVTLIAGARDDFKPSDYVALRDPERSRRCREEVMDQSIARRFRDGPDWNSATFEADVGWELDRLRTAGVDRVVLVDLTRSDFQIPVVRIVIPGRELTGTRRLARSGGRRPVHPDPAGP